MIGRQWPSEEIPIALQRRRKFDVHIHGTWIATVGHLCCLPFQETSWTSGRFCHVRKSREPSLSDYNGLQLMPRQWTAMLWMLQTGSPSAYSAELWLIADVKMLPHDCAIIVPKMYNLPVGGYKDVPLGGAMGECNLPFPPLFPLLSLSQPLQILAFPE